MRKIEDIKPPKKRKPIESVVFEVDDDQEDFSREGIQEHSGKESIPVKAETKKKFFSFFLKFLFIVMSLAILVGLFIFSAFNVKAKLFDLMGNTNDDFEQLSSAISSKNIPQIVLNIENFNKKTQDSELLIQSIGQDVFVLNLLYKNHDKSNVSSLIDNLRAAHMLVYSYNNLTKLNLISSSTEGSDYQSKINNYLSVFTSNKKMIEDKLLLANFYAKESMFLTTKTIDSTTDQKSIFEKIRNFSSVSFDFFNYFASIPNEVNNVIGQNEKKSYLVLFLNNAEIRPGGGFIGSFARIDFDQGKLTKIDFEKNIYTLDKAYINSGNHITPPEELKALMGDWVMRDSNLSSDFAESAKKTSWFYEQETGNPPAGGVDGVFAVDTTMFRDLLKITGPIAMPEYNLIVGADNFLQDVQYQVEVGYFKDEANKTENQPKKILADLMPKFLLEIFKDKNRNDLFKSINKGISEKHLLFYFENSKIEDLITGISAGGTISKSPGDYFLESDANIGGYKSSLNIEKNVSHNIEVDGLGIAKEEITIKRKHNGSNNWPDGTNNNFVKIFIPQDSRIEKVDFLSGDNNPRSDSNLATGEKFNIGSEFEKTVVSFWQNTKPQEISQTKITYFRKKAVEISNDKFNYDITIQKQPGIEQFEYNLILTYPFGFEPKNVSGYNEINRKIYLRQSITKDEKIHIEFVRSQSKK